mmetsp:Transcript_24153/g.68038  ORF Transcript_24153/g.68038 Transcript_24153/m.68038 type:complete len:923 (-) Transcript_24153:151-2919(-)
MQASATMSSNDYQHADGNNDSNDNSDEDQSVEESSEADTSDGDIAAERQDEQQQAESVENAVTPPNDNHDNDSKANASIPMPPPSSSASSSSSSQRKFRHNVDSDDSETKQRMPNQSSSGNTENAAADTKPSAFHQNDSQSDMPASIQTSELDHVDPPAAAAPSDSKTVYRRSVASATLFATAQIVDPIPTSDVLVANIIGTEGVADGIDVHIAQATSQAASVGTRARPQAESLRSSYSGVESLRGSVTRPGAEAIPGPNHDELALRRSAQDGEPTGESAVPSNSGQDADGTLPLFTVNFDEEVGSSASGEAGLSQPIIEAVRVQETAVAHAKRVKQCTPRNTCRLIAIFVALLIMLFIGISLGVQGGLIRDSSENASPSGVETDGPTIAPSMVSRPTLDTIVKRGRVICGVQGNLVGLSALNRFSNQLEGFEVDLCKAIAAGIFGAYQGRYEAKIVGSTERWTALDDFQVDVITRTTTRTMARDVFNSITKRGYSFSTPFLYDGLQVNGIPPYPTCVETYQLTGKCQDVQICTFEGSTHYDIIGEFFPSSRLIVGSADDRVTNFVNGRCNVIAGVSHEISDHIFATNGYDGPLEYGKKIHSKEPLCMVTREDDIEWTAFVETILQGLLQASRTGITQQSAAEIGRTTLFGPEYQNMLIDSLASVGNSDEMYERHILTVSRRLSMNAINNGTNGLLYGYPFGRYTDKGTSPSPGSKLDTIYRAKQLRCGALDVSTHSFGRLLCEAVAAAIFSNDPDSFLSMISFESEMDMFVALKNDEIDMVAGALVSVESSIRNHVTFTQPYLYADDVQNNTATQAYALATPRDDPQFSKFCFWVITMIFWAVEVEYETNFEPLVGLYGSSFERMFRDAILFVGDYGFIYDQSQHVLGPMQGRNRVNERANNVPGPQHLPLLWDTNTNNEN